MNEQNHAEVYEGKVLEFRRDKRVSPDLAIGIKGVGVYSSIPRKGKTGVTMFREKPEAFRQDPPRRQPRPILPGPDGGDAA